MLTLHQQGNILITVESVKEKECKGEVNIGGGVEDAVKSFGEG